MGSLSGTGDASIRRSTYRAIFGVDFEKHVEVQAAAAPLEDLDLADELALHEQQLALLLAQFIRLDHRRRGWQLRCVVVIGR